MLRFAHLEVLFHWNSHIIQVWCWLVHYAPSSVLIRHTLCSHLCVCSSHFVCWLIHTPGTSLKEVSNKHNAVLSSEIPCKRPFFLSFNYRIVSKMIHVWKIHCMKWMAVVKQGMSLEAMFSTSELVFAWTTWHIVILFTKQTFDYAQLRSYYSRL